MVTDDNLARMGAVSRTQYSKRLEDAQAKLKAVWGSKWWGFGGSAAPEDLSDKAEKYMEVGKAIQDVMKEKKGEPLEEDVLEKMGLLKEGASPEDKAQVRKMVQAYKSGGVLRKGAGGDWVLHDDAVQAINDVQQSRKQYDYGEYISRVKDSILGNKEAGDKHVKVYDEIEKAATISKAGGKAGGLFDVIDVLGEKDPALRAAKLDELKGKGVDISGLSGLSDKDIAAWQKQNEPTMRARRQGSVLYEVQQAGEFKGVSKEEIQSRAAASLRKKFGTEGEPGEFEALAKQYAEAYVAKGPLTSAQATGLAVGRGAADAGNTAGDPMKALEGLSSIPDRLDNLTKAVNGLSDNVKKAFQ
jgi:hypothetical protein